MRIEGPTPSGGAYAVAVYLRDLTTLEEVPREEASAVAITEYDGAGRMIMETFGEILPPPQELDEGRGRASGQRQPTRRRINVAGRNPVCEPYVPVNTSLL